MPLSAFQPAGGWERGVLKKVLYGGGGGEGGRGEGWGGGGGGGGLRPEVQPYPFISHF